MIIKKIKLSELRAFYNSEEYRDFEVKPISQSRVESYLSNPRKNFEQFVVYLALENNELMGFRTIFQDGIFVGDKQLPFGWFSGNWVSPHHRRKGVSTLLFNAICKDWDSLMVTNLAPASERLYNKEQKNTHWQKSVGTRFYFKPIVYKLLKDRFVIVRKMKWLVKILELLISLVYFPYKHFQKQYWTRNKQSVEIHKEYNNEITSFLNTHKESVFSRSAEEYEWICKYPWVKVDNEPVNYPFSYKANVLKSQWMVERNTNNEIIGVAYIKNMDGSAIVPYFASNKPEQSELPNAIVSFVYETNGEILTVYNSLLLDLFSEKSSFGLFGKAMIQNYYVMKGLNEVWSINKADIKIQDGDGDFIFT